MNSGHVLGSLAPPVRFETHWSERLAQALMALVVLMLLIFLASPLVAILKQSLLGRNGEFTGIGNFLAYARSPALLQSLWNSLWVATTVTLIATPLAFVFAYALARTCIPFKGLLRGIALVPLLAPSLLSAIALIYWFGNQGVLKTFLSHLGIEQIYGAPGIVMAECFAVFPHALMILLTALSLSDARLYEAADAMGTSARRKFFTITLPGAKYGLISAALVTFTLVITDFGVPKVIGGNFNVLATDVFKLVIGQQDFPKGAVVAILLLLPALLTFGVERFASKRQVAMLTARAIPFSPRPSARRDRWMGLFCATIAIFVLGILGMAVFASLVTLWPYNLTLSLRHYKLGLFDAEVAVAFLTSIKMAAGTAFFGTLLVFSGAYLLEKTKGLNALRWLLRLLALLPMAVPGLVLGLGYIFFFNAASNPIGGLYHTLTLLTICSIVHFYTTGHLTAITALKSLDNEFEAVSASLKVPFYKTFFRVTMPVCAPTLIEMARYFFVNAMTTISAVVFLYSPDTKPASIAILNLDEAGELGAAAAMAILITLTSALATVLFMALAKVIDRRTQAWRHPER